MTEHMLLPVLLLEESMPPYLLYSVERPLNENASRINLQEKPRYIRIQQLLISKGIQKKG